MYSREKKKIETLTYNILATLKQYFIYIILIQEGAHENASEY